MADPDAGVNKAIEESRFKFRDEHTYHFFFCYRLLAILLDSLETIQGFSPRN